MNLKTGSWDVHGRGTIQRGRTGKKIDDFFFAVERDVDGSISIEAVQNNGESQQKTGKEDFFQIVMSDDNAIRLAAAVLRTCLKSISVDANQLLKLLEESHASRGEKTK